MIAHRSLALRPAPDGGVLLVVDAERFLEIPRELAEALIVQLREDGSDSAKQAAHKLEETMV